MIAGGNMKIDHTGVPKNAQLATDVCPVMFEDSATEPYLWLLMRKSRCSMGAHFGGGPLRSTKWPSCGMARY